VPTADVARALGEHRSNGQVLVAFGADHGVDGLARKRGMLDSKKADLVVYNDVSRPETGFDSTENEVVLISEAGERQVERASKGAIAAEILDEVERLLRENGGRAD
jgi:phosphopantothenoylcysteine decarboxylase/phosphopantothenate--cysteine ligase